MQTHIRGYCERAATPAEPGTPIRFTASTEEVGRDGLIISADGWQLDNFRANPAVLWSHDYSGQRPPIGRATVEVVKGKLMADITFDQGDEFARQVERKYREGFLNTVSVGWDTQQVEPPKGASDAARVTKAELLDISAVNIPGDPGALMERQKRAMADAARELITLVDDAAPESATWNEVSSAMVSLFASTAQRPDTERQREYRRLSREYARHGKTAPEWMPLHDLEVLGPDEIRGLFLEGEADAYEWMHTATPEQRAGAVLSKRNADDLATAISLITGVMERATKEPETTEPDTTTDDARAALVALHRAISPKD
jgi:hypothetical protein